MKIDIRPIIEVPIAPIRQAATIARTETARLMLEAQRELAYTAMSVKQVAIGLGFADAAYFTPPDARQVNAKALEYVTLLQIGDVDTFTDWLSADCINRDVGDEADRALRMESRLRESDNATVLGAALLSAHRGDAPETHRCMAELLERYLKRFESAIYAEAEAW